MIAAADVAGPAQSLPHDEAIQRSFGSHDLRDLRAHIGGGAAAAAEALGAEGFATGNHVAFRAPPDLHMAANEATHVIQQRGGVQLKEGVGCAGDAYEQHADAVADLVVRGESAEYLLDQVAAGGSHQAIQMTPGDDAKENYPGAAAYDHGGRRDSHCPSRAKGAGDCGRTCRVVGQPRGEPIPGKDHHVLPESPSGHSLASLP